jgi:hypothetical protein
MSENRDPREHDDAHLEALQAAYDRINSWKETATPETIRAELDGAIEQTGVEVSEATRQKLVDHISSGGGREDVADIIG